MRRSLAALFVAFGAILVLIHPAMAHQTSEQQKRKSILPQVRATTDCFASMIGADIEASRRSDPLVVRRAIKKVLADNFCEDPIDQMIFQHGRVLGPGSGSAFFKGAYLTDLPRIVADRSEVSASIISDKTQLEKAQVISTQGSNRIFSETKAVSEGKTATVAMDQSQYKTMPKLPDATKNSLPTTVAAPTSVLNTSISKHISNGLRDIKIARREKTKAKLRFKLDVNGKVYDSSIVETTGNVLLDDAFSGLIRNGHLFDISQAGSDFKGITYNVPVVLEASNSDDFLGVKPSRNFENIRNHGLVNKECSYELGKPTSAYSWYVSRKCDLAVDTVTKNITDHIVICDDRRPSVISFFNNNPSMSRKFSFNENELFDLAFFPDSNQQLEYDLWWSICKDKPNAYKLTSLNGEKYKYDLENALLVVIAHPSRDLYKDEKILPLSVQAIIEDINASGGVLGRKLRAVFTGNTCIEQHEAANTGYSEESINRMGKRARLKVALVVGDSCDELKSEIVSESLNKSDVMQIGYWSFQASFNNNKHATAFRLSDINTLSKKKGPPYIQPDAKTNPGGVSFIQRLKVIVSGSQYVVLNAVAAIEVWSKSAGETGTFDAKMNSNHMRKNYFDTVVGRITFDSRNNVVYPDG